MTLRGEEAEVRLLNLLRISVRRCVNERATQERLWRGLIVATQAWAGSADLISKRKLAMQQPRVFRYPYYKRYRGATYHSLAKRHSELKLDGPETLALQSLLPNPRSLAFPRSKGPLSSLQT